MLRYLPAILSLAVASFPSWAQEDDPVLRDRFVKGVAQAAQAHEQLSIRAKWTYTRKLEKKGSPAKTSTTQFDVALRGTLGLESGIQKIKGKNSGQVYFKVRNDSYAFGLGRSSASERPSLVFLEQLGVDPKIDARIAGIEQTPRAGVLSAYHLWTDPLFRLIESDSFTIKRVAESDQLVRVEFEYFVDEPARKVKHKVTDGWLVCDPARQWALTEYGGTRYSFITKRSLKQKCLLELGETVGGVPIATKVVGTTTGEDGTKVTAVSTIEVTSKEVPESEFYLSHYGLPEPNFKRSWFGKWAWYLIAGVACIGVACIGAVVKWRTNRR